MKLPHRFATCLLVLALLAPLAARAERYRVDLILFGDRSAAAGESTVPLLMPNLANAIEPFEASKLRAAGIEMIPDAEFGLTDAWAHLKNSKNHQALLRLAWYQKDPPAERGTSLHLHVGEPFSRLMPAGSSGVYPVDGTIALLAGRFLHFDAELVFTQEVSGELRSFHLKERRRVKRDELHHLDSPRLGLLLRAQRADEKSESKPAAKPARPAASKAAPKR
jgi:hypothetical protein